MVVAHQYRGPRVDARHGFVGEMIGTHHIVRPRLPQTAEDIPPVHQQNPFFTAVGVADGEAYEFERRGTRTRPVVTAELVSVARLFPPKGDRAGVIRTADYTTKLLTGWGRSETKRIVFSTTQQVALPKIVTEFDEFESGSQK